jgi:predicted membrane channel-forming protein YqfA (hemolysin III family)
MKNLSIFLIVAGLLLIICGNVFYHHHINAADSGGSVDVTTLNGSWSVKIPAFFGGVMLVFGAIFYYIATDKTPAYHHNR